MLLSVSQVIEFLLWGVENLLDFWPKLKIVKGLMADQQMAFSGFAVSTAVHASTTRLGLSLNERDAIK